MVKSKDNSYSRRKMAICHKKGFSQETRRQQVHAPTGSWRWEPQRTATSPPSSSPSQGYSDTTSLALRHLPSGQVTSLHTKEFSKDPGLTTKFYLSVWVSIALSTPALPQQDSGLPPSPLPYCCSTCVMPMSTTSITKSPCSLYQSQ